MSNWPQTPTERRRARDLIVAQIQLAGMTLEAATLKNKLYGWRLVAPDGSIVQYRWEKGERAIIERILGPDEERFEIS